MEFNYFDLAAMAIILLLGLKGVINGFFKELFGLVGIIGGIFIASRFGSTVGELLNNAIFNFDSPGAINFTGFLVTLAIFWVLMIILGYGFKKLSKLSGLGVYDRLLGFVFGASKFFLIAAVIAHAMYNIAALRPSIDSFMRGSTLFPAFVSAGSVIMKLDPIEITDDINSTIDKGAELIQEKTNSMIDENSKEIMESTKDQIKKQFENNDSVKKIINGNK